MNQLIWGQFWVDLGSIRDQFGVDLGSMWGRFGIDLESVWDQFGVNLGSVRGRFGIDLVNLGENTYLHRNFGRKGIVRKGGPAYG